jgi:ubiquinone biosynthesis protein Coq4
MIRVKQLRKAARLLRTGGPLGDAAILKADALGVSAAPSVEAQLEDVRGYLPRIDLEALRSLPDGTLGREYARMLDKNGLSPFTVSADFDREILRRNTFAARYAVTHDMFHVLTGFDTSWPGEMGVLAFAAAQGYSGVQRWIALPLAALLYPFFNPRTAIGVFRALRRGWRMGKRARFLLGIRLEEHFNRPVAELRAELGIEANLEISPLSRLIEA